MAGRRRRSRLHLTRNRRPEAVVGPTDQEDAGSVLLTLLDFYGPDSTAKRAPVPEDELEVPAGTDPVVDDEPEAAAAFGVTFERHAGPHAGPRADAPIVAAVSSSEKTRSPGDADQSAARRLGVPKAVVVQTSMQLWGHSLTAERDRRARERGQGTGSSTRSAVRGHVTRTLIAELAAALGDRVPAEPAACAEGADAAPPAGVPVLGEP